MHLAPARILTFTDAATGAEIFSTPMPTLAQIEACIRLDAPTPEAGAAEAPLARHRRYVEQLLALVVPAELPADAPLRTERRAFLRSLQYPQLIDLYRKLMLPVQGIDFDTIEEFERALDAQKKSTPTPDPSPAPTSSPGSASSSSGSPSTSTPSPASSAPNPPTTCSD